MKLRCHNLDSCEPGAMHVFPEAGTEVVFNATYCKVVGEDRDFHVPTGMTGVVTNDIIAEAHQVGVKLANGEWVWADVEDDFTTQ